jgi:hypothetical protein
MKLFFLFEGSMYAIMYGILKRLNVCQVFSRWHRDTIGPIFNDSAAQIRLKLSFDVIDYGNIGLLA